MEMLILFVGVCLPLMLVGFYSLYRTAKEERKGPQITQINP